MNLRKYILLIALIPLVCFAEYQNGNKLKADCESTSSVNQGICLGYILAVTDIYSKVKICPPSGVTAGQLESISKKYLNDYPERLHYTADSLVFDALSKAFPCAGKK